MKKPIFFLAALVALLAFTTGCSSDPVDPTGPTAELTAGTNAILDSGTVDIETTFLVKVSATAGDANLSRIEIREDGVAIPASRLTLDGDPAGGNPSPLAAETRSLNWDVNIVAPSAEGTYTYTGIITDENGLTAEFNWDVTAVNPLTPVDTQQMVLLLNQSGPMGTGGLDLDTRTSTGTQNDTIHDIADTGIDGNLPLADNWKQQFEAANGAVLKSVASTVSFDEINFKEDIVTLYDDDTRAFDVTGTTDRVEIGDLFLVKSASGTIFFLNTSDIVITTDNNDDRYVFTVKL